MGETEAKTMIATVTDMQHPCGQFPSTLPSTPERMPTTLNLAPLHLHQLFQMVLRIPTRGLQQLTSTENVQELILGPQLQHLKLQVFSPLPLKQTVNLLGETCNILLS